MKGPGDATPDGPDSRALLDVDHLRRQTLDDNVLAAEVLALFRHQAQTTLDKMAQAGPDDRRRLAHTLKGAARGVGAFAVAEAAESVEADPADDRLRQALAQIIGETCDFIDRMDGFAANARS